MIQQLYRVGFTVSDLDPVLAFYTQVLPFEIINDYEVVSEPCGKLTGVFGARMRVVTLGLGQEQIQLTQFIAPPGGRPIPPDSRSNDLWFQHLAIVVSDMDTAYATLREHNVQHVSTAPQTLPDYITAAAGIRAFYFRDPDGHNLELIWFPEGKGSPRWQSRNRLFLLQYPQTDRNKEELGASPPPAVQQGSVYQGKPKTSSDFALGSRSTMLAVTTRNKLHSIRFSLPMLRARRYVSAQLATTPGLIRYVSAIASPTEFLTLTVWENRQVMFNFMNSDAHRRFMWMFTRWSASFWSMRWMPTTMEEGAWNEL